MRTERTSSLVTTALLLVLSLPSSSIALCGDADGDGYARAGDALWALQAAVGLAQPCPTSSDCGRLQRADINRSGNIEASDALATLQAAVGLHDTLDCAGALQKRALVATAGCDFISGGVGEIDLATRTLVRHLPGLLSGDSVLREQDGRVFALNRFAANNVQELDPAAELATLWQCSTGPANPHDLVIDARGLAWISRYDSALLLLADPDAGPTCADFLVDEIDLSAWADADGIPEMDQLLLRGDRLLVLLQLLDRNDIFRPSGPGRVLAIDTVSRAVVASTDLAISNPFAETKGLLLRPGSGELLVGGPGLLFSDLDDGGIQALDPDSLADHGLLITGNELGGDLVDFVMAGRDRGFALVADAAFTVSLVEFDLALGKVNSLLFASATLLSDLELADDGSLWLADHDCGGDGPPAPGLLAFSAFTGQPLLNGPLATGLPPFNLLPLN
ncbi:MAG: hypothetical protein HRT46_02040 [Deltaproteobacteria bacterium]|nr:hypothetical protein [Deltaproteobacteria bacterium]